MNATLDRLTAALADRYTLERELGAGGMATVYLAEDLKHKRRVALKVLKPELAAVLGAERFIQEITTTAALQHPHILPLFDSGTADGFLYYVMPFIDGETLRGKLDRETQLGIDESVRIATDVASALHYAHQHGVIHRDIKPENILLHDGRPMVADFGIALALSAAAGGRMTETGMSLGTPHYMSPEQATAEKEITARSDVYSLGSVLYEMLTGNPPHTGASAQQIIMKIVTEDAAPVTRLRKSVPANVSAAVAKSLEKLPADRFESAKAFADALGNPGFTVSIANGTSGTGGRLQRAGTRWTGALTAALATVALAAVAVAVWALRRPTPPGSVGRYAVVLDSAAQLAYRGTAEPARLALTPDGQTLVYVGNRLAGYASENQLFVRPLRSLDARALPGTMGATRPAVSWDGSQVAFLVGSNEKSLLVVPLAGGPPLTLVDSGVASGPAWGPEGFVYYLDRTGKIRRVAASGGPIENVVQVAPSQGGGTYHWLTILPGGRGALVGEEPVARSDDSHYSLHAVDLTTGRLGATWPGVLARYVVEAKVLLYVLPDGSLMSVPFDPSARELRGRPQALFAGVSTRSGETDLDIASGMLVYALQGTNGTEFMAWVNRAGGAPQAVDSTWDDTEFESFALSPDGNRLAITVGGGGSKGAGDQQRGDIWIKQLERGPISRLTFGGDDNSDPSWSADGRFVSYSSLRGNHRKLWRRRADGVGEEQLVADVQGRELIESRWSRDGAWLLVSVAGPPSYDILAMQLAVDTTLRPLLAEPYHELKPSLSPDGSWLAYVSTESGAAQVFVRPFPDVQAGKWQISLDGGTDPVWSADGRELYFRSNDGDELLVADMTKGPALAGRRMLTKSPRTTGFELNAQDRMFDVSPDGRRFLVSVNGKNDISGHLVVVQNFIAELQAAMAAGKDKP